MKKTIVETTCDTCGGRVTHPCSHLGSLTLVDGQGRKRFEADICELCHDNIIKKLMDAVPQGAAWTYGIDSATPVPLERVAEPLVEASRTTREGGLLNLESQGGGVDIQAPGLLVWIQEWEESERGWGVRPDGYTIHQREQDIQYFLGEIRATEAQEMARKGQSGTPDEYSRPSGKPFEALIRDDALIAKVKKAPFGLWGPGQIVYERITNLKD